MKNITTLQNSVISPTDAEMSIYSTAAQKIINDTEQFLQSISGNLIGNDTVTIVINGEEKILNTIDYISLKEITKTIKAQMKADIQVIKDKYKTDLANELNA